MQLSLNCQADMAVEERGYLQHSNYCPEIIHSCKIHFKYFADIGHE